MILFRSSHASAIALTGTILAALVPARTSAATQPVAQTGESHSASDSGATTTAAPTAPMISPDMMAAATPTEPPPVAFEYSDAYQKRAKIHRLASFATLPLFGAEAIVGESLYKNPTPGKRTAHLVIADAIGGLFAVNSVTGVWNLAAARKDPNGRVRRWIHGSLMLAADAGFLATAALGPHDRRGVIRGSPSTHRAVAFASIGLATSGYVVMLIGR